jgi:threonine dehydrogenase-like Zn-dependent dehydrogenase
MTMVDKIKQAIIVIFSVFLAALFRTSSYKIGVYNEIPVRNLRLLSKNDEYPQYESATCDFITTAAETGQTVVVIGSGLGVSTVKAANRVGSSGRVYSFEASKHRYEIASETVKINSVQDIVQLKHAIVGVANDVFKGDGGAQDIIIDSYLEECDILEMDCEGAELDILRSMDARPRTVIVETHGNKNSSTTEVTNLLIEYGYEIVDTKPENKQKDVVVVKAELNSNF